MRGGWLLLSKIESMTASLLFHQIESLPEELRQQVADFVAFLQFRRLGKQLPDDFDLTDEELDELDNRWAEYQAQPDSATDSATNSATSGK